VTIKNSNVPTIHHVETGQDFLLEPKAHTSANTGASRQRTNGSCKSIPEIRGKVAEFNLGPLLQ
jgi:hypothetical protein